MSAPARLLAFTPKPAPAAHPYRYPCDGCKACQTEHARLVAGWRAIVLDARARQARLDKVSSEAYIKV